MTTSRGLLHDYEPSCRPSFEALVQNVRNQLVVWADLGGGLAGLLINIITAPLAAHQRPAPTPVWLLIRDCVVKMVSVQVISLIGWHLHLCTPASGQELFWHRYPNFKIDTTLAKILNICFMCYDPAALQGRNYLHPVAVKRTRFCDTKLLQVFTSCFL